MFSIYRRQPDGSGSSGWWRMKQEGRRCGYTPLASVGNRGTSSVPCPALRRWLARGGGEVAAAFQALRNAEDGSRARWLCLRAGTEGTDVSVDRTQRSPSPCGMCRGSDVAARVLVSRGGVQQAGERRRCSASSANLSCPRGIVSPAYVGASRVRKHA